MDHWSHGRDVGRRRNIVALEADVTLALLLRRELGDRVFELFLDAVEARLALRSPKITLDILHRTARELEELFGHAFAVLPGEVETDLRGRIAEDYVDIGRRILRERLRVPPETAPKLPAGRIECDDALGVVALVHLIVMDARRVTVVLGNRLARENCRQNLAHQQSAKKPAALRFEAGAGQVDEQNSSGLEEPWKVHRRARLAKDRLEVRVRKKGREFVARAFNEVALFGTCEGAEVLLPEEADVRIFHAWEDDVSPKPRVREQSGDFGERDFCFDGGTEGIAKNVSHAVAPSVPPDCLEVGDELVDDFIGLDAGRHLENVEARRAVAAVGRVEKKNARQKICSTGAVDLLREVPSQPLEEITVVIQNDHAPSTEDLRNHAGVEKLALAKAAFAEDKRMLVGDPGRDGNWSVPTAGAVEMPVEYGAVLGRARALSNPETHVALSSVATG